MANSFIEGVAEFHQVFDHLISTKPTTRPFASDEENKKLHDLRVELIREETRELQEALELNDLVEVADAVADLLYVVIGAGLCYGIPMEEVFAEVHRSNMTKLDENGNVLRRDDGKILKSALFEEPQPGIRAILERHLSII